MNQPRAAIVDYGMGNLFSARQAAARAGFDARIVQSAADVRSADAVVLPGMGAFGDAMAALREQGLVPVLQRIASDGRPLMGVCLGMQLLMSRSFEFGEHEGLGIIRGDVRRLDAPHDEEGRPLKVPHIGWSRICRPRNNSWRDTPLESIDEGQHMYFVHSFHVIPDDADVVLSTTSYGHVAFCSTLTCGSIFATQYHPERSGPPGLAIYRAFAQHAGAAPGAALPEGVTAPGSRA